MPANVLIGVNHSTGISRAQWNQRSNGDQGFLGEYAFAAGSWGDVIIRNTEANGYVVADAVQLVLQSNQ